MYDGNGSNEPSTLTLSSGAAPRPPRVQANFGAVTHRGNVRTNNEDHFLVARLTKAMRILRTSLVDSSPKRFADDDGYLMIVADGLGGAAAGERASGQAIQTVQDFALNSFQWFLSLDPKQDGELQRELRAAIEEADRVVFDRASSDRRLSGMGSTLTMGFSVADEMYIANVGDSRAYLYRDGVLDQITRDDTLAQLLVDAGQIPPEAARTHARRHVVTNVIGGPSEGVTAKIHKLRLLDGDVLVLCSDGLTEPVRDDAIAAILAESTDPESAANALVDRALDHGGPDNVTVVVARYRVET